MGVQTALTFQLGRSVKVGSTFTHTDWMLTALIGLETESLLSTGCGTLTLFKHSTTTKGPITVL